MAVVVIAVAVKACGFPDDRGTQRNLYSITTNQEAIRALFRVVKPLRRQPAADARRVSGFSGPGDAHRTTPRGSPTGSMSENRKVPDLIEDQMT